MFISKRFSFFSGENKKMLWQSGKGNPKSLWWKIEATFLISFGGRGGGDGMFAILHEGDLGELDFQQNLTSFMKSKN